MNEPTHDVCLLNDLAHEFSQRLRQGEHPSLEEYVQKYPRLADEIRETFPLLSLLESSQRNATNQVPLGGHGLPGKFELKHLGEYRIVREIGRGGMGVVFEAIQEPLGRRVALKVLPAIGNATGAHLDRFRREVRVAARLNHTNIVPVYDVGEADGVHFYSMQFIDGRPLNALLDEMGSALAQSVLTIDRWKSAQLAWISTLANCRDQNVDSKGKRSKSVTGCSPIRSTDNRLPNHPEPSSPANSSSTTQYGKPDYYRHIAHWGRQVADALAYAHGQGVLHRDIKPSNLLLDADGTVWITDFGLAQVAGQDKLTSSGDVVGTLCYLAPERFEGQMDERGDIYSLGVTLYELLTGRPPFTARTRAALISDIVQARPTSPRRIDPQLPRDLETIVLKSMSHDPSKRYAQADLLSEDLDRYLEDRPISARPLGTWGTIWRWCRRNRAPATAVGVAVSLLVAIFVISLVDSVEIRKQLHETKLAHREARERTFDSLVSQAHARWMGGNRFGRRFETLGVLREATSLARELQLPQDSFSRLRNEALAALCLPDEEIAKMVDAWPVGTAMVDFDPRVERYARGDIEGNVTIHRVSDNHTLHRLPSAGPDFKLALWDGVVFSPDGNYLQHRCQDDSRDSSQLRLWDVAGVKPRLVVEISEKIIGLTAFAPDSRHLGVVIHRLQPGSAETDRPSIQVHIVDTASGEIVGPRYAADESTRLVFHPQKAQLAISDARGVRIVQRDTGTELARWNRPGTTSLAWSPDGRMLLACSNADAYIHRWDVANRRELSPLNGQHSSHIDRIVFSHSGDRFISISPFRFQMWDFPSGQVLWDSPQGALRGIRFSHDDQLLAGFHGVYPSVRILRVASGRELRRIALASPTEDGFARAVMTGDGRILAATAQAGTVLLDLQTYEELGVIPGTRIPILFEPNGSLLTHADAPEGVVRWPINVDAQTPLRVSIGQPIALTEIKNDRKPEPSLFSGLGAWSASDDGRLIATPWQRDQVGAGANIFIADADRATPKQYHRMELGSQHDVRYTSVSPDGKWVATGSVSWMAKRNEVMDTVTIWEAATGRRVKDLWVGEGCPQFSRDGKWIAVTSSGFAECVRLWRVGSWQPAPAPGPVPGPGQAAVAFDAESRMMAVQGQHIRLLVPATGRELARLAVPEETSLAPQCFTPDGRHLIACGVNNGSLYIWDLHSIRKQLGKLGLDWDSDITDREEQIRAR